MLAYSLGDDGLRWVEPGRGSDVSHRAVRCDVLASPARLSWGGHPTGHRLSLPCWQASKYESFVSVVNCGRCSRKTRKGAVVMAEVQGGLVSTWAAAICS